MENVSKSKKIPIFPIKKMDLKAYLGILKTKISIFFHPVILLYLKIFI